MEAQVPCLTISREWFDHCGCSLIGNAILIEPWTKNAGMSNPTVIHQANKMQYSVNLQRKSLACPVLPSSTKPTKRNFTKTVSASNVRNPHVQAMWEPLRADSYTMQVIKAKLNVLSTICIIDSQNWFEPQRNEDHSPLILKIRPHKQMRRMNSNIHPQVLHPLNSSGYSCKLYSYIFLLIVQLLTGQLLQYVVIIEIDMLLLICSSLNLITLSTSAYPDKI